MRFDFEAYEKVYPKQDPIPEIDTAVEGFTPTADEISGKAKDDKPDADPKPEQKAPITVSEEAPPEGENNG